MLQSIKTVLMNRDGMSEHEADDLISDAKQAINDYLDSGDMISAYDVCEEYFGLEPDYLDEIMPI